MNTLKPRKLQVDQLFLSMQLNILACFFVAAELMGDKFREVKK